MKRLLSFVMVIVIMCSSGIITAFAALDSSVTEGMQKVDSSTGAADIPITVTRAAQAFNVTVPTSLPVSVGADGKVVAADNVFIENNGSQAICVKKVSVSALNNWSLSAFDKTAMLKEKPDVKKVGLSITMGGKTAKTSTDGQTEDIGVYNSSDIKVAVGTQLAISYDAVIPARISELAQEQAASVIFTVDWAE